MTPFLQSFSHRCRRGVPLPLVLTALLMLAVLGHPGCRPSAPTDAPAGDAEDAATGEEMGTAVPAGDVAGESADPSGQATDDRQVIEFDSPQGADLGTASLVVTVLERKDVPIDRTQQTSVELASGFSISLPAGAVPSDTTLQVLHAAADQEANHMIADFEFYRVIMGAADMRLSRPAIVRLPYNPDELGEQDPADIRVGQRTSSGEFLELQPWVDEANGFVEVEVSSLSEFWTFIKVAIDAIRGYVPPEGRAVKLLTSYYSQADYQWCWAACAAMLASTHNRDLQPHEVAAIYGGDKSTFKSLDAAQFAGGLPLHRLNARFGSRELTFQQRITGVMTTTERMDFLIAQLDAGRPVWVFLPHLRHFVVVVGYDHAGFYIHDPEGLVIEKIERQVAALQKSRCYYPVSYENWMGLVAWLPWVAGHAFITQPLPAQTRTLTLQILPILNESLTFVRHYGKPTLIDFHWNAYAAGGCGFFAASLDPPEEYDADATELEREGLCNSDSVTNFPVVVHNTQLRGDADPTDGGPKVGVNLEVWLASRDGSKLARLGPQKPISDIHLQRVNQKVDLLAGESVSDLPNQAPPYTPADQRGQLPLRNALNFVKHPMPQGEYVLEVHLYDKSGNVLLDRVRVPFTMRPAVVPQPEAQKRMAAGGRVLHRVTWRPSPEESRVGIDRIRYSVHRTVRDRGLIASVGTVGTDATGVTRLPDGTYEWTHLLPDYRGLVENIGRLTFEYQIRAIVDGQDAWSSPLSLTSNPLDAVPVEPSRRYELVKGTLSKREWTGSDYQLSEETLSSSAGRDSLAWESATDDKGASLEVRFAFPSHLDFQHEATFATHTPLLAGVGVAVAGVKEDVSFSVESKATQSQTNHKSRGTDYYFVNTTNHWLLPGPRAAAPYELWLRDDREQTPYRPDEMLRNNRTEGSVNLSKVFLASAQQRVAGEQQFPAGFRPQEYPIERHQTETEISTAPVQRTTTLAVNLPAGTGLIPVEVHGSRQPAKETAVPTFTVILGSGLNLDTSVQLQLHYAQTDPG